MSYKTTIPTKNELDKWSKTTNINPRTGRKIKINGPIYKILLSYLEINIDNYSEYRSTNVDPILMTGLPLVGYSEHKYFKFKYKWNPYTGERQEIDKNGYLSFDPDTLIYYFYNNRLNYLWESTNDLNYTGYFGDAVGNGPNFEIKGRGTHPDWYLFRLPIIDCYLHKDHCHQSVTMGPILTNKEINEIDRLAKTYKNNYKNKFKMKRPRLKKIKALYDEAIDNNPKLDIEAEVIPFVDPLLIKKLQHNINIKAVKKLIKI
jgi:hypothetical protein